MKYTRIISLIIAMLLLLPGSGMADDFNPVNPPEPQVLSKLTVKASPARAGKTTGTGRYLQGTRVYLNTSVDDVDYAFKCWEKDGVVISNNRSFYYTTTGQDETITAVYEYVIFNPDSPAEPSEVYKWPLQLACEPEEACSFNLDNGSRYLPGTALNITAYPSQGFVFNGWFRDGEKISDSLTMPFTMPRANASLVAKFTFIPVSPDEPMGGLQTDVDNTLSYDVNGDGYVNVVDATTIIAHYLAEKPYLRKYDLNGDGYVNVVDATAVIAKFLAE